MNFKTFSCTLLLLASFFNTTAQSQKQIDSLEKWVAKYAKEDSIWVKNLIQLENLYERELPKKEGTYVNKILEYSEKNNFFRGLEEGLLHKANYYAYNGQYQKAIETIFEKLKVDTKNNDLIRKIDSYTVLATFFGKANPENGQEKTLEYFLLAHETALQIPKNHPKRSSEIAKAKLNIASGYYFTHQYEKALKVYIEAAAIQQKEIDKMPNIEQRKNEQIYFNTTSALNIGSLYFLLNRFSESEKSYLKGIEFAKKGNLTGVLVQLYNSITETYLALDKPELAKKYLDMVAKINESEKLETTSLLVNLQNYEKYYLNIKDFEKAYRFKNKLVALNDSLKGDELQQKMRDLTIKYETDKKEQENKQLAEKNVAIEKQNRMYLVAVLVFLVLLGVSAFLYFQLFKSKQLVTSTNLQLTQANEQKDKLFKIISHDLKTPATTFVQLTSSINHYIKKQDYTKLNQIGDNVQILANDLQSIVNNLLFWSMSQQGLVVKRTEKVYINEVLSELKEVYENYCSIHHIEFQVDTSDEICIESNRIHLSTTLRNLIANAIKFTPDGKIIKVEVCKENDKVYINIHDSGEGFSEQEIEDFYNNKQLKPKNGLHGEKSTGLGLNIAKELIDLYEGEIRLSKSDLLNGACISIILKFGTRL